MKVLVACEYSGRVRDAFRALGHDAISCDLEPTEVPGPHIQGDVWPLLMEPWDLVIAHPPCDYLANSGVRWRVERQEWQQVEDAARFFLACLSANAPRVAVENPVMHRYGREHVGRGPDFTVQPWHFGDPQAKRTCFWTSTSWPAKATGYLIRRARSARPTMENAHDPPQHPVPAALLRGGRDADDRPVRDRLRHVTLRGAAMPKLCPLGHLGVRCGIRYNGRAGRVFCRCRGSPRRERTDDVDTRNHQYSH